MRTATLLTAATIAAALVTTSARAATAATPVIFTNVSNLLPNTPNQVLKVFISGNDIIQGENLDFQINNGTGPIFSGVDILTGTIFAASNTGQTTPNDTVNFNALGILITGTASGHLAVVSTTTVSPATTVDNGLLATLLITTTATTGTTFTLNLLNTINGSSNFGTGGSGTLGLTYPHMQLSVAPTPDRVWKTNGSGAWNNDANWNAFAPYVQGDIAEFLDAATSGTAVVTLDGVRTAGTINFNNAAASYDITPGAGGSILLDNGAQTPVISSQAGRHAIDAPIALAAASNITVASGTLTISGAISGAGDALSIFGGGKLLLTSSANSYGATNIAAGASLQIGNGTQSGSVGTGPITTAGTLTFTSLGVPVTVPMSGSGPVIIEGFVALNNTSTTANMIITTTGLLQVGNGGTLGLLTGVAVINSGILAFNRSDAAVQTPTVTGAGTLTQMGVGTTTIGAAASYTGPTIISSGQLSFGSGLSHAIAGVSGTGKLAVDPATTLTSNGINLPSGSLTISGTSTIRSSGTGNGAYPDTSPTGSPVVAGTSKVSSLTFAATNASGQIDITNNGLIIQAANSASKATLIQSIAGQTATLFNLTQTTSGFYNIISSTAVTNPAYSVVVVDNADLNADLALSGGSTSFGGLSVDANSVLVTQALQGDANIDGTVDFTDLNIWFRHFGNSNSFSTAGGDLNNDGVVDFTDLNIWFRHFGNAVSGVGNPFGSGGSLGGGGGLTGSSPVPEPTSVLLLGLGTGGLLMRRRKRANGRA